jgi:L,D-peptidoglycan transpeptidase YkuD (ErfK/YbiS/YcfS/YnhG family)
MLKIKAVPAILRSTKLHRRPDGKPVPQKLRLLTAMALPKTSFTSAPRGLLQAGHFSLPCAIGAGGVSRQKREGDGATPAGRFRLLAGFFKPTAPRPSGPWPLQPIQISDGWCDDPDAPAYNRLTPLPSRYNCEQMWRNDGLYDLVVVLDYNIWPRRRRRGSAIFLHCARPGFAPTAGCIALRREDLRKLLPRLARNAVLVVR